MIVYERERWGKVAERRGRGGLEGEREEREREWKKYERKGEKRRQMRR